MKEEREEDGCEDDEEEKEEEEKDEHEKAKQGNAFRTWRGLRTENIQ